MNLLVEIIDYNILGLPVRQDKACFKVKIGTFVFPFLGTWMYTVGY